MPYLLILIALLFTSCGKKENALSQFSNLSSLEQRTFIIVNHEDGKSILRKKMLNQFVEEKIPSSGYVIKIEKGDELLGNDLEQRDLISYANNERNMAKIVVSFTDREEIFFLPKDISLKSIPDRLNLKPEAERNFKWIKTDMYSTYAGGTFYLASVNTNDIVENDQEFFHETSELKDQYMSIPIKLMKGKIVELDFTYEIYLQREVASSFSGRSMKCTRDMAEAGMCGGCTYNRNVPSGDFDKTGLLPVNELGLVVRVGSIALALPKLALNVLSVNQFIIKMDAKDFEMENALDVHVEPFRVSSVDKNTVGYNYSSTCQGRSESAGISLQRRAEANVLLRISGRGYENLKNIL